MRDAWFLSGHASRKNSASVQTHQTSSRTYQTLTLSAYWRGEDHAGKASCRKLTAAFGALFSLG